MLTEMNAVDQAAFLGSLPFYTMKDQQDAGARSGGRLPMLDWPENLFSSAAAMADDKDQLQ